MAKTVTYTKTETRINLIKAQVEIVLTRTTDLSENSIDSILKGIEKQWICEVNIYGFDTDNLCTAQLTMKIDWHEHNLQIRNGNVTVTIAEDGRTWTDNTPVELGKVMKLFKDYVTEKSLKAKCRTFYTPGVNREEANRTLGFVSAEPIKWKSKANGFEVEIEELKELGVGFYCVD